MQLRDVPRREWLAVVLPPTIVAVLLVSSISDALRGPAHEWIALGCAFVGGVLVAATYTAYLAQHGRLFLRDEAAISRSRSNIENVAKPVGWALAVIVLIAGAVLGASGRILLLSALAGLLLGLYPGLLANFFRLWRESWLRS